MRVLLLSVLVLLLSVCVSAQMDSNSRDLSPRELRRLAIEEALDREEEQQHAFETESSDMGWNSMYGIGGLPSNLFNYPGYAQPNLLPVAPLVPAIPSTLPLFPSAKVGLTVIPPLIIPGVIPTVKVGLPVGLPVIPPVYPSFSKLPVAPVYPSLSKLPATLPVPPAAPAFSQATLPVPAAAPAFPHATLPVPPAAPAFSKLTYAAPIVSYAAPIMEAAVLPPDVVPQQQKTALPIFQPDFATAPMMTVGAISATAPTIHKGYGSPLPLPADNNALAQPQSI